MGFEVITPKTANPVAYYGELFRTWVTSDLFLAMYPFFGSPLTMSNPTRSVDRSLLPVLKKMRRRTKTILYVVDLPLEQVARREEKAATEGERTLFSEFDVLCVVNHYMKDRVTEKYGIPESKMIEFEVLDYSIDFEPPATKELKKVRTIAHTGTSATTASDQEDYILSWFKDVPRSPNIRWEFIGSDGEWIQSYGRDDMVSHPFMDAKSLAGHLASNTDFGMIVNKFDEKMDTYYNYVSTTRLGTFMTAGVPVIVPSRYAYMCELVRKYGIGWIFDSPHDLPSIIEKITQEEYRRVRAHTLELGNQLKNGHFFKNAITEAMRRLGFQPGAPEI